MPDTGTMVTDLPETTTLDDNDLLYVVASDVSQKITKDNFRNTVKSDELINIRTDTLGNVYDSAGNAVRGQISATEDLIKENGKNVADIYADSYSIKYPIRNVNFTQGKYINSLNGNEASNSAYSCTAFLPVMKATKYLIEGVNNCYGAYYNSSEEYLSSAIQQDHAGSFSVESTSHNDAKYLRISCMTNNIKDLKVNGTALCAYMDDHYQVDYSNCSDYFKTKEGLALGSIVCGKNHFDKSKEVVGKFILRTLVPSGNSAYNYAFLDNMKASTTYTFSDASGNNSDIIVAYFDRYGNSLGWATSKTFTTPNNVKLVCLSYRVSTGRNKNDLMVEEGSSASAFEEYKLALRTDHKYIVDVNGSGDYTSLTACLKEATKYNDSYVYVLPGTYNIINEYKALYGNDFFENITGSSTDVGIVLKNRITVEFAPGSTVTCIYEGDNTSAQRRFTPLNSGPYGFTLIGCNIISKRVRYSMHDERSSDTDYYHNKYVCCHFKHDKDGGNGYIQALGGGLGKTGFVEVQDSIFESVGETGGVVSFHNSQAAGAQSNIVIKDSIVEGTIRFSWYGESTLISTMKVSNCKLKSQPYTTRETSAYDIENVELIAWNNVIENS